MKQTYYSNGKLLITGEYTVLDGAKALALPTTYGQYLYVEESDTNTVRWTAKDSDGSLWLDIEIPFETIYKKLKGQNQEYDVLISILHEAHLLNPLVLNNSKGFVITTALTFPRNWGLGTSSTLINNISNWFAIDAFNLLEKSFGGSGYDIACAQNNTPVVYHLEKTKPITEAISFSPAFTDKMYFVYLNKKQNSREAIAAYKEKRNVINDTIILINNLTKDILNAKDLPSFQAALDKHEAIMSVILETATVKDTLFSDFQGTLKSLGAWGGDFILAASQDNPTDYFMERGYETIIPYNKMILK